MIISIVVLILIGAAFYYYKKDTAPSISSPVVCAEGDKFNIITGEPCSSDNKIEVTATTSLSL